MNKIIDLISDNFEFIIMMIFAAIVFMYSQEPYFEVGKCYSNNSGLDIIVKKIEHNYLRYDSLDGKLINEPLRTVDIKDLNDTIFKEIDCK